MKRLSLYILLMMCVLIQAEAQKRRRIMNVTEYPTAITTENIPRLRMIGSAATAPLPCMGSPKVPVILVQFQNKKFSVGSTDEDTRAVFNDFFNAGEGIQPGPTGYESLCSVKEYFRIQSNGQFTPEFTIIGPVTISENYEFYGENRSGQEGADKNITSFYSEACKQAVTNYSVDWTAFDNKHTGTVSFVFFIYAGESENSSDDPNTIWPKESTSSMSVTYEDKMVTFSAFGCAAELYGGAMDGIGTSVHELGHGLGLPDFYDTNYVAFGMDAWDIMDSGCYLMLSKAPCNMTAYERDFTGWQSLVTLDPTEAQTLELTSLSDYGNGYKLQNAQNPNEYLILENRQNCGMDQYLGCIAPSYQQKYGTAHGLMVTHVDYSSSAWNSNRVNTTATHQRMTIVPADNELISNGPSGFTEAWAKSIVGDLYPGPAAATELTSHKAFTGDGFAFTIDNIRETADGKILVDINGGKPSCISELTSEQGEPTEIYTIDGRKLKQLQHGLNIVRSCDGSIKKVWK